METEFRAAGVPPRPTLDAAIRMLVMRNLLWLGTTIVVAIIFWWLNPVGEAWWAVPVLLFAGLWLVLQGFDERVDLRAISNEGSPQEGQWVALCGKAVAMEETDSEILAYRFEIYDKILRDGRTILRQRYDGFFLRPTGLETDNRVVPLAGFPDLVHYHEGSLPSDIISNAKSAAYQCPNWMPSYLACEIILSGVRNRIQTSLRYREEAEASEREIKSRVLNAGDPICVFGIWRNGELHPSKQRPRGLPVYAGTAAQVREHLGDTSKFVLGLGAILLVIALAWAIWSLA